MIDMPRVSIVICTRNRAQRLDGTLRSLAAIRSIHAWEVLLVDNASTDETSRVIREADDCGGRLRYVLANRIGLGAARDLGWREARGDVVSFTDDDCYLDPGYVDAVVRAFADHPAAGCIGGRILLFDPLDARVTIDERDHPVDISPFQFVEAGALQGANLSFRRRTLERIGGIDPALGAGTPFPSEDIDAVAATLWSGLAARFDPAPVVHHHHRRRGEEAIRLNDGYDRGRGAYYAKYLMRRDTRMAYVKGWWGLATVNRGFYGIFRFVHEIRGATRYLRFRKRYAVLAFAIPLAVVALAAVVIRIVQRAIGRRVSR